MPVPPIIPWRRLALLWSLLAIAAPAAHTNSAWFARVWQSDDGLPNNNVNALAQTADGYLWVATPVGLARFDGIRFDQISSTNFINSPNRGVMALLPDGSGGLWLEMDRGAVVRLHSDGARVFTSSNGLPDMLAETLVEADDGTVWITYLGGGLYSLKDGQATPVTLQLGLPAGPFSSVAKDIKGRIWMARGGHVGLFDGGRFKSLARIERTARITRARVGGIWICSGPRLFRYDENGPLEHVGEFPADRPGVEAIVLMEDSNDAVWMGSSFGGLFRYDGNAFEKVPTSHQEILSLLEDREGNIWAGTRGGGLDRLRPRAVRLEGEAAGLPFDAVQSVCEDTEGALWGTTANGLVVRRTGNVWSTLTEADGWRSGPASCVAADADGAIWIGTKNYRLGRWQNGKVEVWGRSRGVEAKPILTLLVSRTGDLWIGGQNRMVQRLRNGEFLTIQLPEDARVVRASAEDAAGNVWFGTSKGLLLRVEGDRLVDETARTGPTITPIRCLHATPDGSLWIGYAGVGVGRLKDGQFALIGAERGLFDAYISQIVADGRGWLWFGADHGIFKVRQQELDEVAEGKATHARSIHYGRGEGLPSLQADFGYAPGATRRRDGRLWIPTRSGLAVVDPDPLSENAEAPPVLVKRLAMDEKTIAAYDAVVPAPNVVNLAKPVAGLRLRPGHRKIEFEFTALSFAAVENVRFQYRLEGFDESWIESTQRGASYSRLPAGDYRFRVKACSSGGVWNESGAMLAFAVAPFVWQTWWFRLITLVFFCSMVVVTVRYVSFRHLRLRLQALEQQAALDRERARIARDLHDDLGSRLTKIVLLSDLMLDNGSEPEKTLPKAQQISATARQVIKALDETVWAVNPRNDTLPHLINYIGQFAVEFLRPAGIQCRVDLPERPPARVVPAEVRHNLFLVVKESLNNVVRHASATEVWLQMTVAGNTICLTIEDNGHGFAARPEDPGADGLRNMRQRVEEIGGRFTIEGRQATGTRVSVTAPCKGE